MIEVAEHWRFATVRESTGDELGAALSNLLALRGLSFADVEHSIVSSTVPQLSEQWTAMARALPGPRDAGRRPVDQDRDADPDRQPARGRRRPARQRGRRLRARRATPASSSTSAPRSPTTPCRPRASTSAGSSRPAPRSRSTRSTSARRSCPKVELAEPRALIGKSTVDAIRSGIVFGFAGQVEGIVRRLRGELGARHDGDRDRRPRRARSSRSSARRSTRSTTC